MAGAIANLVPGGIRVAPRPAGPLARSHAHGRSARPGNGNRRRRPPGRCRPPPRPTRFLMPPGPRRPREAEGLYFDPGALDAEVAHAPAPPADDPVATGRGRIDGAGHAAVFLSDFHISDGTAGGDDFLESHLRPEGEYGGRSTGYFLPGESRTRARAGGPVPGLPADRRPDRPGGLPDVGQIRNGDVVDSLALKGRGGAYVSRRHLPLFRALATLRGGPGSTGSAATTTTPSRPGRGTRASSTSTPACASWPSTGTGGTTPTGRPARRPRGPGWSWNWSPRSPCGPASPTTEGSTTLRPGSTTSAR